MTQSISFSVLYLEKQAKTVYDQDFMGDSTYSYNKQESLAKTAVLINKETALIPCTPGSYITSSHVHSIAISFGEAINEINRKVHH